MGAEVFSFDYDQNSVECALQLKHNFFKNDEKWVIEKGDVLSEEYLSKLGKFDIVYSWGVLHHTGNMYKAFQNVTTLGKPQSELFIAIYNDQGNASKRWKKIKELYNKGGMFQRTLLAIYTLFRQWTITFCRDTLKYFNPLKSWNEYDKMRGMSPWHDIVDWVGGYPFEVAKPEEVFSLFHQHGFNLMKLKTCAGGLGCNEFVFYKN
jgi:2-polyprenyl-6-hydroxyphenyl methylase/3-demethylubiquinone-9 3-methyltransferase